MYVIDAPPFVEIAVVKTEEQLSQLQWHPLFVKLGLGGSQMELTWELLESWVQEIIMRPMRSSVSGSLADEPFSRSGIAKLAANIIGEFENVTNDDDIFYVMCQPELSRQQVDIRAALTFARGAELRQKLIGGILYRQQIPATYWFSVPTSTVTHVVRLAFCESEWLQHVSRSTAWMVQKNGPTQPTWAWYVPAEQQALAVEPTLAVADDPEVEQPAFAIFREQIEKTGTPVRDYCYKPNGRDSFPDCRVVLKNQKWAVEITQPLGSATDHRVATLGDSRTHARVKRAGAIPGMDKASLADGLKKAVKDKSGLKEKVNQDEKYCLLLVDTVGVVYPYDGEQWEECDLSAFDSVVLVRLKSDRTGQLVAVKGDIPKPSN